MFFIFFFSFLNMQTIFLNTTDTAYNQELYYMYLVCSYV